MVQVQTLHIGVVSVSKRATAQGDRDRKNRQSPKDNLPKTERNKQKKAQRAQRWAERDASLQVQPNRDRP